MGKYLRDTQTQRTAAARWKLCVCVCVCVCWVPVIPSITVLFDLRRALPNNARMLNSVCVCVCVFLHSCRAHNLQSERTGIKTPGKSQMDVK